MATQSPQLAQRFALFGTALALALMVGLGLVASRIARHGIERLTRQRGLEVASRVGALASHYMLERRREVELLAANPAIIAAARAGARFAGRQPSSAAGVTAFLRLLTERGNLAQVFVTDGHGLVVAASRPTDRFVRAEESWWRAALRDGTYEGNPQYDTAAAAATIDYAVAIRSPGAQPLGVVSARISLEQLTWLLAVNDLGDGAYLQVVDSQSRLLVTPSASELLQAPAQAALIPRRAQADTVTVPMPRGPEIVISIPANRGGWWVLFRQPKAQADAAARDTVRTIWIGVGLLLGVSGLVLWQLVRWLSRRVTAPVQAAGQIASRVASGDLSVTIPAERGETAEVGQLLGSVHAMVLALRRLVGAIRSAAEEASAMAAEISAATQQMSASTEQMAATAQDLTRRATEQSDLVRAAADHAARILEIATVLSAGADEAARRNTALSSLARKHRELLDESTAQLEQLAEEVTHGAAEAEALGQASAQIQKFVTQAKNVATQTNMLALNAAIEAARAGPQGRGFAVVAEEVRKLAAQAAAAAGETSDIVRGVLGRVQATRDRLVRLAASGAAAREAAQVASQALNTVAAEADANDAWSREIAASASDARTLVEGVASRLASVAQGTESLVAAAEQLAASGQEQSASTEEIASSANQLAEAADRLTGAVQTFRLLAAEVEPPHAQAAD